MGKGEIARYEQFLLFPCFQKTYDECQCDRIHSFLTPDQFLDNSFVVKQSVVWKDDCKEYKLSAGNFRKASIGELAATM